MSRPAPPRLVSAPSRAVRLPPNANPPPPPTLRTLQEKLAPRGTPTEPPTPGTPTEPPTGSHWWWGEKYAARGGESEQLEAYSSDCRSPLEEKFSYRCQARTYDVELAQFMMVRSPPLLPPRLILSLAHCGH